MYDQPPAYEYVMPDHDPDWLKRLRASPVHTDTIRALLPIDPNLRYEGSRAGGYKGLVTADDPETIRMWGSPNPEQARNLLLHESGHVLQFASGQKDMDLARAIFGVQMARDPKNEMPMDKAQEVYPEWFADAFRSGINTLNSVMEADPSKGDDAIDRAEQEIPGTKAVVEWLLQQPIFARHPIAQRNASMYAKAEDQFKVR